MAATYTWDVFSTVDGYGSYDTGDEGVDRGGYWSKQGPEYLAWRAQLFDAPLRILELLGSRTFDGRALGLTYRPTARG